VPTKNRHLRHMHPLIMWARRVWCCHVKGGPFITWPVYLKVPGSVEERSFNAILFSLHIDMLIIFKKLITINECNFRFTNIKIARTITSVMKSSMKIPLFQWNQVSKHSEWKSMINAWFGRFKININLNIFFITLIRIVY
jgi:hypothetical protein